MVSRKEHITIKRLNAGDVVVDGLFAGIAAGLAMIVVLVLLALLRGELPAQLLSRFSAGEVTSPWMGLLRHMAVSVIYGMAFGLAMHVLARYFSSRWAILLAGFIYGLILFALAQTVILPGTDSPLRAIRAVEFGAAHLVYGLTLGVFFRKS